MVSLLGLVLVPKNVAAHSRSATQAMIRVKPVLYVVIYGYPVFYILFF